MGTTLAARLYNSLSEGASVLAIELAYILQAVAVRKRLKTIPTEAELPNWVETELATLKERMNGSGRGVHFDAAVIREHPLEREQKQLSPVSEKVMQDITEQELFPPVTNDRYLADDIKKLANHILNGGITCSVNSVMELHW
jgi:histidine ammonia-lyase